MITKFLLGGAAALTLSTVALAQAATAPGVAGGVQPYRPAGSANATATSSAGIVDSAPGSSSISSGINTTLQAGQVPSNGSTVGTASAGGVTRVPNAAPCVGLNCANGSNAINTGPAGPGPAPASSTGVGGTVGGTVGR